MKFTVVILVMLGLLAAGSAAILVQTAGFGASAPVSQAPATVEVVVAAAELPAMTVLRAEHMQVEEMPKVELPADHCVAPAQAIGRVLMMAVVKGQLLRKSLFLPDNGAGASAAAIPPGMRVFTISVSAQSISGGLICPGCIVDVLAIFTLRPASQGEAIATTVLRGVQVWAIEDESVVTARAAETAGGQVGSRGRYGGSLRVSLLVDTKQLESLQLAVSRGNIALAIRNPLDNAPIREPGTLFNPEYLHGLGLPPEPGPVEMTPVEEPDVNAVEPAIALPQKPPPRIVQIILGPAIENKAFEAGMEKGDTKVDE